MADLLTLVRHGEIDGRYRDRFIGRTDVPLNARGQEQAMQLGEKLRGRGGGRLVSSPLMRARGTAEILADPLLLDVEIDDELREIDFGRWEGLSFEEICARDQEQVDRWATFAPDFAFPGGEALQAFEKRICSLAGRLAEASAEHLVLVTHGGVIRSLLCHYLGLKSRSYVRFDVRRASITTLEIFGDKGVLKELNNECYAKA